MHDGLSGVAACSLAKAVRRSETFELFLDGDALPVAMRIGVNRSPHCTPTCWTSS